MADRATLGVSSIQEVLGAAPQTFLLDYEPTASEIPVYKSSNGGAVGLTRISRNGDFCSPPTDIRIPDAGIYITGPTADVHDIHPSARAGEGMYSRAMGGVMIIMDGIEVIQPKYNLIDIQGYLVGNPWHYAAVKAKATAATELGYEWRYTKKNQKGVISSNMKALSSFEDRIYARNHKDLATLLRDQALDFFSTGNKTLEVAYNMGGKVDCIYSVPAITVFRHPVYPVAVQAIPEWDSWGSIMPFDGQNPRAGLQVKAVMPLYMSGLYKEDLQKLFPDVPPALFTDNEMVHVTNAMISTDPFYGVADILPALSAMFGDNAANDYNWQFFENNAVPRYAVTISGGRVDKQVSKSVVDFFNREIQGRNHRTIVIPLPRDMTANFQALDATQNDASFIQFKKLNREEIAAAHSVPPSEIGLWEDANKANSSQQAKNYFLKVIRPYQAKDEAMMNRILKYGMGISDVVFKFKNVEYTDDQEKATVQQTRADAHKKYIESLSSAIITIQGLAAKAVQPTQKPGAPAGKQNKSVEPNQQAPMPMVDEHPVLTKAEAKEKIRVLIDKIMDSDSLFDLDGAVESSLD